MSSPLCTVFFLSHASGVGGAEVLLLDILQRLDRRSFRPVVITVGPNRLYQELHARGYEVIIVPLSSNLTLLGKHQPVAQVLRSLIYLPSLASMLLRLVRLFRSTRCCVIYTFSIKADVYGSVAAALAKRPCVWHMHDMVSPAMFPQPYRRVLILLANHLAALVICNSAATRQEMIDGGLQPSRAVVVHSGVDTESRPHAADVERARLLLGTSGKPVIGLIGRIAPWKGQHVLLEAAPTVLQSFPDALFLLVGGAAFGKIDADYERQLRARVDELGLTDHVMFTGHRDDAKAIMKCCSVVVQTSVQPEPFGLVVAEAMALGKPVVATRSGGVPEIVEDGRTGKLVTPGDASALAAAIVDLLQRPGEARAMGEAARAAIQARFTIQASVAAVERVLRPFCVPCGRSR